MSERWPGEPLREVIDAALESKAALEGEVARLRAALEEIRGLHAVVHREGAIKPASMSYLWLEDYPVRVNGIATHALNALPHDPVNEDG